MNFPDQSKVADFSKRNNDLSDLVSHLKKDLPFTTMDQLNAAESSVQTLVSDFNNFDDSK